MQLRKSKTFTLLTSGISIFSKLNVNDKYLLLLNLIAIDDYRKINCEVENCCTKHDEQKPKQTNKV